MKNPCKHCIVKACCTQFCDDKENFTDYLNNGITFFGLNHIYSKNGNKKKKVPRAIRLQWEHKNKLQKINIQEINTIINRRYL